MKREVVAREKIRVNAFDVVNIIIMVILCIITLAPFWISLVGSFNEGFDYAKGNVYLWPRKFTTANFVAVFADHEIITAFIVTIARTVLGTVLHVFFTLMVAYGMTRNNLKGRKIYLAIFLFTMFFYGGIIPQYLLYQDLHLTNNFLVYVIPGMFAVWDMTIFMSSVRSVPEAMLESARIDGASEYAIFFKFIIPLSKPVIAAIALFTAVGHWNSYFDSMMFTTDNSLQTIQLFLMRIITSAQAASGLGAAAANAIPQQAIKISPDTIKLATMVVTTAPIIIIYPLLQKYFIKGMYIGSVKG